VYKWASQSSARVIWGRGAKGGAGLKKGVGEGGGERMGGAGTTGAGS